MARRQSARMRDGDFTRDYASRYTQTFPADRGSKSVLGRSGLGGRSALERSVRRAPGESLASWVWNFDQAETRLLSLVNRGKYAEAKKYYDELTSVIDSNYDGILDLTSASDMGEVGAEIAKRAARIANNDFLDSRVKFGDTEISVGQLVRDGGRLATDAAKDEFEALGLTGSAAEMLFNGTDAQRSTMKSLIQPMVGSESSRMTPQERMQRVDLAEDVVNHWDELEGVFGDGVPYFITRLQALHAGSGGLPDTMRALVKCAAAASSAKGLSGKDLARDVISGYSNLTSKVFARDTSRYDGNGKPEQDSISPSKRMSFDSTLVAAVNALTARGEPVDLSGAAFTTALTEVMDAQAFAADSGIDLVALGHDAGKSAKNAFGEYIADRAAGVTTLDANPINAFMSVRNMMSSLITGGDDFSQQAYRLSGNAQDYAASLNKANGGYSKSFGADGLAYGVKSYLLQKMAPGIMAGKSADEALHSAMAGDVYSGTDFLVGLSNVIGQHMSGPGGAQAGDLLAGKIMESLGSGRGVSMESAIYDLAFGEGSDLQEGSAPVKSLRNWYYGNISEVDRYAQDTAALRAHYRDHEKLPEHTSSYLVGKVLSKAAELERNGMDGRSAIDAARKTGTFYYTVTDPATGAPKVDQFNNPEVRKGIGDLTQYGYQLDGDNSQWETSQAALAELYSENRRFDQARYAAAGKESASEV